MLHSATRNTTGGKLSSVSTLPVTSLPDRCDHLHQGDLDGPDSSDYGDDISLNDAHSDYGSDISLDEYLFDLLDVPSALGDPIPSDSRTSSNPSTDSQTEFLLTDARLDTLEQDAVVQAPFPTYSSSVQLEGLPRDDLEEFADYEAIRDPAEDAVEPAIPGVEDHRSPYERFRSKKGALTVTDLVSNLWCEQQLEYTLIRGFKRRTPAMKAGSSVHRVLEEQVHTIVPVKVKTKEDRWGLKLFNMCQGLRCLETEGLTRELPVFGFLDDVLVRGIIDEVVYKDPAGKTEDSKTSNDEGSYKALRRNSKAYIDQQPEEYSVPPAGSRVAYISDVKSRARRSLPTASQANATALQLMSYHRLLDQMRAGKTDFPRLLNHYKLNGDAQLSDSLIADLCRVSGDVSIDTVLKHNSLTGMWELMRKYLATSIDSIGGNMGISYRDQADGKIFAYQTIPYNGERLDAHLGSVMSWWRGQRSTVGVDIEEAWKCASCEFANDCSWRLGKLSELKKKRQVPVYYPFARKA